MSIWDKINENIRKTMDQKRPNNSAKQAANSLFGNLLSGAKPFQFKTHVDPQNGNPKKGLPFVKLVNDAINNEQRMGGFEEAQKFQSQMKKVGQKQHNLIIDWNDYHMKIKEKFRDWSVQKGEVLENSQVNFENFQKAIKANELIGRLASLDLEKLSEIYVKSIYPDTLKSFKKEFIGQFKDFLVQYGDKLIKSRFPPSSSQHRSDIYQKFMEIVQQMNVVLDDTSPDPNVKLLIYDYLESVREIEHIDYIILNILKDTSIKAKEFAIDIMQQYITFNEQLQKTQKQFLQEGLSSDYSNKQSFQKIHREKSDIIRITRFGRNIKNQDLSTLQEGNQLSVNLVEFMCDYFVQKIEQFRSRNDNEILLFKPEFFRQLMPGGLMTPDAFNYSAVKNYTSTFTGYKNTVFDRYNSLGFPVALNSAHWVFVEVKNKPQKEIIVYDSLMRNFEIDHPLIINLFRRYILEEYTEKSSTREEICWDESRKYIGRTSSCPQQIPVEDSGVCLLKNVKLYTESKPIHGNSYNPGDITEFRYQLFDFFTKLSGLNDLPINYDILM